MSTSNNLPVVDLSEFMKTTGERISQIEKNGDSLKKRFEDLKAETEKLLNQFVEDSKKVQASVETLAASQKDTITKLNLASDEIRSIGGRNIPRVDPAPVAEVKEEMGLSLFDLWEE